MNDIICARITAPGTAAIAVIRISGKGSIPLVARYFRPAKRLLKARANTVVFGTFYDAEAVALDEVLLTVFQAPKSYTGEDTIELSCHGNPALADRILTTLLGQARLANPGEFTLRAYLNGKMDLSQAEAVNDLILANSSKAETAALMQIKGYLGKHLAQIMQDIQDARLRCELAIDFCDQDLPQIDLEDLAQRLDTILGTARALKEEGESGIKLREGIKICLAGAPNSGKSSLFNAFLKQNRAIVTSVPGTTRDYLEESFSLSGYPIVLYDTAGLRDSEDEIEKEGIARSYDLIKTADLILYLYEGDFSHLPEDWQAYKDKLILVATKADIFPERRIPPDHVETSVRDQNGLKALSDAILGHLKLPTVILEHPLITNVRHLAALSRSITALEAAQSALRQELGFEFIAFELISAHSALEEILGLVPSDELLNKIFDQFCIGK
ncbi:MAG: tRNA uridine-5-carboxymethylaminomethyl(34) synthesis GTPase MnmE [Candidatus Cloacimonetes bacterium]|nr:tRNA uridine-5-carboxymethylaminomethyl(34) synthesis GTPase MnmE [Candidatus Cloacimonadota bacterium]MDY0172500.1 tRNA uridine-5-carboxymethylaminomethyl(34) synthesis GTPase MnmE [Candidatus Cloacimonadaceae bacterium]